MKIAQGCQDTNPLGAKEQKEKEEVLLPLPLLYITDVLVA
jgi:hypothetical protein